MMIDLNENKECCKTCDNSIQLFMGIVPTCYYFCFLKRNKPVLFYDFCEEYKPKSSERTRNLTDEETEIYESWIDHEAKDTGVNIMDGEKYD